MTRPRIADLVTIASRLTGVDPFDVRSQSRLLHLCAVRVAVYVTARRAGHSYPGIGRLVGGRDHSTVIHGIQNRGRFANYISDFDAYCADIERFAEELPPFVEDTDWTPDQTYSVFLSKEALSLRNQAYRAAEAKRRRKFEIVDAPRKVVTRRPAPVERDYDMEATQAHRAQMAAGSQALLKALAA